MEILTFEYAVKNKLTYVGIIRYFEPDWDESQCMLFLSKQMDYSKLDLKALLKKLNEHFITDDNTQE